MHSRLRLFLLAGVASMQVDLAQEPTVQQENARDLNAAYCVGVLTIDIRETQKRLQSKDADDNAREIWRSWIRNFQDRLNRYQTYGVPRLDEPGREKLTAERRRGERDVVTAEHMSESCLAKCRNAGPCYRACFLDPAKSLLDGFAMCERGEAD